MNAVLPLPERFVDRVNRDTGETRPFEQFWFIERDGRVLITPSKLKFDWKPEERDYRSIILDSRTGEVLSIGFPKFANYGEESQFGDHMRVLERDSAEGRVRWLEKMDGSTCIRSVIDGEVVLRTRGTHDGGDFGPHMRRVAAERYPVLLDPSFKPDESLIFEFVSKDPSFQIVVRYDEDDLVLLASRSHATLEFSRWDELERLAGEHGLNLVDSHELPGDVDGVLSAVREWRGTEGVVARCGDDQVFVKVKSASYLLLHRLRTQLTAKGVREMCERERIDSLSAFQERIKETGADWEMVKDTEPIVLAYLASQAAAEDRVREIADAVVDAKRGSPDDPRAAKKHFAQYAMGLDREDKVTAFSLYGRDAEAAEAAYATMSPDRVTSLRDGLLERKDEYERARLEQQSRVERANLALREVREHIPNRALRDEIVAGDHGVEAIAELEEWLPKWKEAEAEARRVGEEYARLAPRERLEREFVAELPEPERAAARDLLVLHDATTTLRSVYLDRDFEAFEAAERHTALAEDDA